MATAAECREILARAQRNDPRQLEATKDLGVGSTHFTMSTEEDAEEFTSANWTSSTRHVHTDPKITYIRPTPPYKNASKVNITSDGKAKMTYESEMKGRYRDNFVPPPGRCPQPPVQVHLGGCSDLTLEERYQSQAMLDNATALKCRHPHKKSHFAGSSRRVTSCGIRETIVPRIGDIITGGQHRGTQYQHFDRRRAGPEDFRALSSDYSLPPPFNTPGAYRDPIKGLYVRTREPEASKTANRIITASNRVAPPLRTLAALRPMPVLPM